MEQNQDVPVQVGISETGPSHSALNSMYTELKCNLFLVLQKNSGIYIADTAFLEFCSVFLNSNFNSVIYNKVLYTLSAWGGYLTRDSINRLNSLFKKALCWRLTGDSHNIDELLRQCDSRLFNQCFNSSHCLNHIFTPVNRSSTLHLSDRAWSSI